MAQILVAACRQNSNIVIESTKRLTLPHPHTCFINQVICEMYQIWGKSIFTDV